MKIILFFDALASCALLYYLFCHIPNRRIFTIYCAVLLIAGVAVYHYYPRLNPPPLSPEQQEELGEQQQILAAWTEGHQKDIEDLDHTWQRYHQTLASFQEDAISIQTAYLRLTQLEDDSRRIDQRIKERKIPLSLSDYPYDLVTEISKKTTAYADAQLRAIALSKVAADPAMQSKNESRAAQEKDLTQSDNNTDDKKEKNAALSRQENESRMLQTIMMRESPAGLFTANENAQLRLYFAPSSEEKETKNDNLPEAKHAVEQTQ